MSADAARGGEIILRTWRHRAVFITGLIGALLIGFVAAAELVR